MPKKLRRKNSDYDQLLRILNKCASGPDWDCDPVSNYGRLHKGSITIPAHNGHVIFLFDERGNIEDLGR